MPGRVGMPSPVNVRGSDPDACLSSCLSTVFTFLTLLSSLEPVNLVHAQSCAIMVTMEVNEPDDLDRRLERARRQYDRAHAGLYAVIREALAAGRRPARIGRHTGWTREYIAKIRDGKTGGRTP